MPAQDLRTANFDPPLIDDEHELEASRLRLNEAVTTISLRLQEIVNQTQSPDAGTLGGQDLSFVLSLANAIGILPVSKGGTGATDATGARAALGIDAAWDVKFAAALNVAPEQLNTILEIVAEIQDNDSAIAAINTVLASKAAQTALDAVETRVTTAEAELDVVLPGGASGYNRRVQHTTTTRDALTGMSDGDEIYNVSTKRAEKWTLADEWDEVSAGGVPSGATVLTSTPAQFPSSGPNIVNGYQTTQVPMPAARQHHGIGATGSGRVVVIGGDVSGVGDSSNTTLILSEDLTTWAAGPDFPIGILQPKCITAADGKLVVIGGWTDNNAYANALARAWTLDDDLLGWTELPVPPRKMLEPGLALHPDGRIFVLGGQNGSAACNDVNILSADRTTWSTGPDMPDNRWLHAAGFTPEGSLFYAGGAVSGSAPVNKGCVLDSPYTGAWSNTNEFTLHSANSNGVGFSLYGASLIFMQDYVYKIEGTLAAGTSLVRQNLSAPSLVTDGGLAKLPDGSLFFVNGSSSSANTALFKGIYEVVV